MRSKILRLSILAPLAALLSPVATGGCSADTRITDDETVSSVQQPILNGSVLNLNSDIALNLVNVPGCSGVALNSEWVLTAGHCVNGPLFGSLLPALVPDSSEVSLVTPATDSKKVREFATHSSDFALLRVYPFASTGIQNFRLWNASLSSLASTSLFCTGRGRSVVGDPSTFGTWRWAGRVPSSVTADKINFTSDGVTPIQLIGDSGGPCTYYSGGAYNIVGITRGGVEGSSCDQNGLNPTLSAWVDDIRYRSELFFYRKTDGLAYVSSLERNGTYASHQQLTGFGTDWSNVKMLRNGAVLFYNSSTGMAAVARINKDSNYIGSTSLILPYGYTHIVPVGYDRLFMYNSTTGAARTARLTADLVWTTGETLSGFGSGWTNVVGTAGGALFFYEASTGTGVTATVDANLHYTMVSTITGFSHDWSYVTAVNDRGIFFYNGSNGTGYTAEVSPAGAYVARSPVSGIGSGYSVVGATNGTLLFRNSSGGAKTASVSTTGVYTPVTTLSGFSTAWTHLAVE